MKELSIEEKAKLYDEAIERAKDYYHLGDDKHKMAIDAKAVMEYIFPELKESEDEKMIQYFKDLAPFDKADELYEKYGFSHKDAIAWLEKQGGHAKFINGIQVGDKVTRNEDGVPVNLSQLNRVAKKDEKQGKQKPADKVEPNFCKGDWVVYCNDDVDLITGIEENGYTINEGGYIPFVCASDIRLWTVQDAKDGDVLATQDSVFIFKHIDKTGRSLCKSYCEVIGNSGLGLGVEFSIYGVYPATKEQRDLLFQKMKEAGYEWDAEKKELKKIEQKNAWCEEDEKQARQIERIVHNDGCTQKLQKQIADWLKSLKGRVRPQNKWKESLATADLENSLCDIQDAFSDTSYEYRTLGEAIEFIRCTEQKPQWKPSDEQMLALDSAIHCYAGISPTNNREVYALEIMKEQLKKLRGE